MEYLLYEMHNEMMETDMFLWDRFNQWLSWQTTTMLWTCKPLVTTFSVYSKTISE